MGRDSLITKQELIHGEYYYGFCRNANTARWNAERNKFYHWRDKFGQRFVETINHYEDDNGFDTFKPRQLIDYGTPKIPFPSERIDVV